MKICFVDLFMDLTCSGGSMHSLDLYATKLAAKGHDVSILTLHPKRNVGFDRRRKPYALIEERVNIGNPLTLTLGLKAALKKHENFDVFHVHDPRLLLGAALYRAEGGRTPVVGDLNTYLFHTKNLGNEDVFSIPLQFFHRQRLALINKHVNLLLPVSPTVERMYGKHGISGNKMLVVPDGFDIAYLRSKKTKSKPKRKNDCILHLLYVGRLEYTKGVDLTIRALAGLRNLPLVFHVAGEGPQLGNLKKLAKELGVQDKVIFHGFVSEKEMFRLYSNSDVFIHAARWEEPFGRAVAEAMAFGLPVIVSDIGAPPWVAGKAGLAFKAEDVPVLSKKITLLFRDAKLRSRLSGNAHAQAKRFGVQKTISGFLTAYSRVV